MDTEEHNQRMRAYLEGVSILDLRILILQVMRQDLERRQIESGRYQFDQRELGKGLISALTERQGLPNPGGERLIEHTSVYDSFPGFHWDWSTTYVDFVSWFTSNGYAIVTPKNYLRLTSKGIDLLSRPVEHPLLPGSVQRLSNRCPGLPQEVTASLIKAQQHLSAGDPEEAVFRIGRANEATLKHVERILTQRGQLPEGERNPAAIVRDILRQLNEIFPGNGRQEAARRAEVQDACRTLGEIRNRRNYADHPDIIPPCDDIEEAEELFVSFMRRCTTFWLIVTEGHGN